MEFIPTVDERMQRYKVEAFSFVGDHPFVYMHCKVKICNATDPNSRCAQGCLHDRRKRSLYSEETNDEEYNLDQGPFILSDEGNDETKALETLTEVRDVEKSGKLQLTKRQKERRNTQDTLKKTNAPKGRFLCSVRKVRCDIDHSTV